MLLFLGVVASLFEVALHKLVVRLSVVRRDAKDVDRPCSASWCRDEDAKIARCDFATETMVRQHGGSTGARKKEDVAAYRRVYSVGEFKQGCLLFRQLSHHPSISAD